MEKKAMNSDNVCTQKGQTRTHIEYKISFSTWSFPPLSLEEYTNVEMAEVVCNMGVELLIGPT